LLNINNSASGHRRLTKWPSSWRYRVCFHLIERVSIGDKYVVFKETHHCSVSFYDDASTWWNRRWTEWETEIKNGFRPLYWYKTLGFGGCVFQTVCKLVNLSALFSEGFQRCIFMRIRFLNIFLNFNNPEDKPLWSARLRHFGLRCLYRIRPLIF
jgi:hypothetical protein